MTKLAELFKARGPIRKVGFIGMGYVGIPAAMLQADASEREKVYGFDISPYKINTLNAGENPLKGEEPGLDDLIRKVVTAGKFECRGEYDVISEVDAVCIAVQTPRVLRQKQQKRMCGTTHPFLFVKRLQK